MRRLNDTKRKGHATKAHIDQQVTTTLNKGGNDAADALAFVAAAHHAAPRTLIDAAYERQRTALIMHSFASELLFRRRAALTATDRLCTRSGHRIDCVKCSHAQENASGQHSHTTAKTSPAATTAYETGSGCLKLRYILQLCVLQVFGLALKTIRRQLQSTQRFMRLIINSRRMYKKQESSV